MTDTPLHDVVWDVQTRRGTVWISVASGRAQAADGVALALGAFAAHLMTVDHDRDLDDRRVLVQEPDGLSVRLLAQLTEDDLERHLRAAGYDTRRDEAPLAAFFPQVVHDALPPALQSELRRVGPPRPTYSPGELV
ncbi:hypothetical protein [Actinacidiphila sp. ITFR-21]|uniref:hypothetical protein n=1 Tax=Actinacidiphila sp. ITFR-21 TaxID=3075199 RepID=UPI00288BFE8D|nr:hypothetical protein [Streptomyces sp. ITFR-21]WNI20020.1 hypothetical protein RLT57_31270 [Streptomyces sp. ITFR-21]